MDVYFPKKTRPLRIAQNDGTHGPAPKPYYRHNGIIHFDVRMIVIIPVGVQFARWSHKPAQ